MPDILQNQTHHFQGGPASLVEYEDHLFGRDFGMGLLWEVHEYTLACLEAATLHVNTLNAHDNLNVTASADS